jgi:predicted DNA-binding protein (UPF0251 family)
MTRKSILFLAGMLILALLLAAVGGAVVTAQSPTPQTTPQAPKTNLQQDFWQALADKLGISVETLQQDVKDAAKSVVQKAVQGGQLTQQQADQLDQRIDQWNGNALPFGFFGRQRFAPFGSFGPRGFGRGGFEFKGWFGPGAYDAAAKALGMTTQDLMTELQSGKSLADVATEKGVDQATLKTAIVDAIKANIDSAVTNGRLTQQQADQLKSQVDQLNLDSLLQQPWFRGRHPGFRAPKQQPTPAPSGSSA